jgi:hypothetical protein
MGMDEKGKDGLLERVGWDSMVGWTVRCLLACMSCWLGCMMGLGYRICLLEQAVWEEVGGLSKPFIVSWFLLGVYQYLGKGPIWGPR